MLKFLAKKPYLTASLIALALILLTWGTTLLPSFDKCVGEYTYANAAHQNQKDTKQVPTWGIGNNISMFFRCEGEVLDENQGILTALATLVIAWFTVTLYGATNQMSRSASATIDQMKASEERQLRAYVAVAICQMVDFEPGKCPWANIVFKNAGQTPARNVMAECRLEILPLLASGAFPTLEGRRDTIAPIGPGLVVTARPGYDKPLPEQAFIGVVENRAAVFLFGRINYRDVFGNEWWTSFRYRYGARAIKNDSDDFVLCDEGNDET